MIHVEITPAHPIGVAHRSEKRMRRRKRARHRNESLEERSETRDIGHEFRRSRSIFVLIDLWHGFQPVRPLHREPERDEFHDFARERHWHKVQSFFAQNSAKGIRQVADHLMRRHAAPLPRRIGRDLRQALANLPLGCRVSQGLHGRIVARIDSRELKRRTAKMKLGSGLLFFSVGAGFEPAIRTLVRT